MILQYARDAVHNLTMGVAERKQEELDKTLDLPFFIEELKRRAKTNDPIFHGKNTMYKEPYPRTIKVAPSIQEMLKAVRSIKGDLDRLQMSNKDGHTKFLEKKEMILSVIKPKQIIYIEERPDIWWGDTKKGLNLRLGFVNNDRSLCIPQFMGGQQSHALGGGNTGAGKSVMMNAELASLIIEYPPWELQLIMNDMKKQEYARYVSTYAPPQIRNVCLTAYPEYFNSELEWYHNELKSFADLTTLIGTNSYKGARAFLDMAIPTHILVDDEYTQYAKAATDKEFDLGMYNLQGAVRLGRSFHFFTYLTSQDFAGTMPSDTIGQYAVGTCVAATDTISQSILNNKGAVALTKKVGYCLHTPNRAGGDVRQNTEYKVPFLDDESDEDKQKFQDILGQAHKLGEKLGVLHPIPVFNDTDQALYETLADDAEKYGELTEEEKNDDFIKYFMRFCLGRGLRFSNDPTNCATFNWLMERGANIAVFSVDVNKIKYALSLIGDNMDLAYGDKIKHTFILDNASLKDDYVNEYKLDTSGEFNIDTYWSAVNSRTNLLSYSDTCKVNNKPTTLYDFAMYKFRKDKNDKAVSQDRKSVV